MVLCSFCWAGSKRIIKVKLDLVAIQEVRWDDSGSQPGLYIFPWKWEC